MNPPMRRTRLDHAAAGVRRGVRFWLDSDVDRLDWHSVYRLRVGGHGVPGRVRYQARVAAMASASGVPAVPNAAWYLLVSRTKGSPNW